MPCDLQQNTYSAATIIGAIDRFILPHIVLVSIGTGIVMREQQDPVRSIGLPPCDDVAQRQLLTGVHCDRTGLLDHLGTGGLQAGHHPIGTGPVGVRSRHPRTEVHLPLHESVSTIRIEHRC
jgi:hypothetical protein